MIIKKIKKLASLKATAAALEKEVATELAKALAELPTQYGFESVDEFASAVRAAAGNSRGRKRAKTKVAAKAPKAGRRRRAKITDAIRAKVKKLVEAGKTGGEIAKSVRISPPSVQNIKKALGLVKKLKK
jgi:DNA-binding NarL/FixJ family response regulator